MKQLLKIAFSFSIASCCCLFLHAQPSKTAYFNKAESLFKDKKYFEAAQCYEHYLSGKTKSRSTAVPFAVEKKVKGKTNFNMQEEAIYHLAESYRMYNDFVKAVPRYQEAATFSAKAYPECQYWYGVSLRATGAYQPAIDAFSSFLQAGNAPAAMLVQADLELANLKFIQAQLNKKIKDQFIINRKLAADNASSYAMSAEKRDTMVFTSILKDSSIGKDGKTILTYNNQLFEAVDDENLMQNAHPIKLVNDGLQNGLSAFSRDGNHMYFTKWTKKSGKTFAAIYTRKKLDTGWTQPVRMKGPVNLENYNSTQPYLTTDAKYLLFASDRPGGIGKYDLWYASLDSNGSVLSVANMGNIINTTEDEASPFYNTKSRTLVFSSNGRIGMGGYDIYYAEGNLNFSNWSKPVNPGMPLNSTKDDLYYYCTDDENLWNTGWMSSDRGSECCLELYSVKLNSQQLIMGSVIDCKTQKGLAGVQLKFKDQRHNNKTLIEKTTDSLGNYAISIQNLSSYTIEAAKADYVAKSSPFSIQVKMGTDTILNESICLAAVKDTVRKNIETILKSLSKTGKIGNFIFGKARLEGISVFTLDSLTEVMLAHPDIRIRIEGYTDGKGTVPYNLQLAQKRVDACIKYLVKKGIAKDRLEGLAKGKCCPIAPDTLHGKDNPAGREKNRRVEYVLLNEDKQ